MDTVEEGCPTVEEIKEFLINKASGLPGSNIELLGKGSFGEAFRYKDWVIKILDLNHAGTESTFRREVDILNRIVDIEDLKGYVAPFCWTAENSSKLGFIVQKYVKSQTLEAFLAKHRTLAFNIGYPLLRNLQEGVERLHRAGFIHRDLKPENILVPADKESVPILIDFGFACPLPCSEKMRLGTPSYMPGNWASRTEILRRGEHKVPFRSLSWITRKAKPEANRKHPKDLWDIRILESRTKPKNVNRAKSIRTQPVPLEPEYGTVTDNYSLYLILKQVFDRIDWKGYEEEKDHTEAYLLKLLGTQATALAAQYRRTTPAFMKQAQLIKLQSLNARRQSRMENLERQEADARELLNFAAKAETRKRRRANSAEPARNGKRGRTMKIGNNNNNNNSNR